MHEFYCKTDKKIHASIQEITKPATISTIKTLSNSASSKTVLLNSLLIYIFFLLRQYIFLFFDFILKHSSKTNTKLNLTSKTSPQCNINSYLSFHIYFNQPRLSSLIIPVIISVWWSFLSIINVFVLTDYWFCLHKISVVADFIPILFLSFPQLQFLFYVIGNHKFLAGSFQPQKMNFIPFS